MVPAAYADNENEAEDESVASLVDCDENEVEQAGFDCIAVGEIGDGGDGNGNGNGNGNGELLTICHVSASGQEIELTLPEETAREQHLDIHDGPLGEEAGPDYEGECDGRSNV